MLQSGRTSTRIGQPQRALQRAGEERVEVFDPCGRWATRDQLERFARCAFIEADDETHTTDDVHAELADLGST
jgi:hypothetical protein